MREYSHESRVRARAVARDVEEFLSRGGKIEVVDLICDAERAERTKLQFVLNDKCVKANDARRRAAE